MTLPSSRYAPVQAGCKCRRVPLYIDLTARVKLKTLSLPPHFPVHAYPCRSCGKRIIITAGDLGIAPCVV